MAELRIFRIILLVSITFSLAACGGQDSGSDGASNGSDNDVAPTTINFLQPLPKSTAFYPLFVAEEMGYFEEEGVTVNLLPGGELPETAFIDNGEADVAATGATEIYEGLASGTDYDVVYDYYQGAAEGIVVPEGSDIMGIEDLEGTTVGLASDSDLSFLKTALSEVGLSEKDVATAVVGGGGPVLANSFESEDIDAFAGAIVDFASLEANGIELRNITPDTLEKTPAASFIVAPSVIEEKEEALDGFMRAWAKGTHVGYINREVVATMSREAVPEEWQEEEFGQAFLDVSLELQKPSTEQYGELRPKVWRQAQQQLIENEELEQRIDVSEFLNDRFIEEANDWNRQEVETEVQQWAEENL